MVAKNGTVSITSVTPTIKEVKLAATSVQVDGMSGLNTIQATATSEKGSNQNENVIWSVSPENKGVTVNETGLITITNMAEAAEYTIRATGKGGTTSTGTATATLKVTRAASVATSVKIYKDGVELTGGTDTAVIPPTETSAAKKHTYTAKAIDQFGAEMSVNVPLSAEGSVGKATFDASKGTLTVEHGVAANSSMKIKAVCGSIEKTITVKFVSIEVPWTGVSANANLTYGVTNQNAVTIPKTGTATVGDGQTLAGTYSVDNPTATQGAGSKTVNVVFTVTEGEYKGTMITHPVTVSIGKKSITATVKATSVEYKKAIPSFDFDVTGLVGSDKKDDLGLTLTTTATSGSNVGTYAVTKQGCTSANYDVTVADNTAFSITPATITGIQTAAPSERTILANAANNTESGLRTELQLPEKVTVAFAGGTEELGIVWTTPTTFNKKGGEYTFTGKPTVTANFKSTTLTLTAKITVTAVTGTASISSSASTKAFAEVTGAEQWSDLSMPTQVTVSYDNGVTDGTYTITDWTPNLGSLKAQATGTEDKTVPLKPSVDYPEWATISNQNALTFTMTITPKYPVTVKLGSVTDVTYGTEVTVPVPTQEAINHGTDANGTYTYIYEGTGKTSYGPSDTPPTDAGTYKVTAKLVSGTHSGTSEPVEFTITPKTLEANMVALTIPTEGYTYDKTAKKPKVTVTDEAKTLAKDTDYTVVYADNINASTNTAKVTVTGKGNYAGAIDKTFDIAKASIADMKPVISGTPEAGYVLTASLSGVADEEVTWQWYAGGTAISGATSKTYTVQPTDSNAEITVKATAAEKNYTGPSAESGAVTVAKVTITGTVTVSLTTDADGNGKISAGDIVTATAVVQPSGIVLTYYWNGSEDAGTATYTVQEGDELITVVVTAENYEGSLTSAPVEVGKSVLSGTVTVAVDGGDPAAVGSKLTATVTVGSPATANDYTISWLRNGEVIDGATGTTYTVVKADQGTTITVKVTAAGDCTGELVSSTGVDVPAAAPDAPTVTAGAGNGSVTVKWTTPDGNGAPIISYKVSNGTETIDIPVGTNSHTFTGLTNGTAYTFTVKAVNSKGESAGGTASATPVAPPPPPAPSTGPSDGNTTVKTDSQGNVTTTTKYNDGSSKTSVKNADGSSSVVTTDAKGKTNAEVSLPAKTVEGAESSKAPIALPMQEVAATRDPEKAPAVVVKTANDKPVNVKIPVSNVTAGTVAILVKADGTETIIKTSVPTEDGVALKLNSGDTVKIVENSTDFDDTEAHWGVDAVDFVSSRELFNGTGDNKFSPDGTMTRGMLMTVLARFEDVDTTAEAGAVWYEKGVAWAMEQGLSDGTKPDGEITREQLATIMYRFAKSKGLVDEVEADLSGYTDAAKVSSWAREAMAWAVHVGLILGVDSTTLAPNGNATRTQAATILMRYAEKFAV